MPQRPRLLVEGVDDAFVFRNLLVRYGWSENDLEVQSKGVSIERNRRTEGRLVLDAKGSDREALRALKPAIRRAVAPFGLILDADIDQDVEVRWAQVRGILEHLGIEMPQEPVIEGFVGTYRTGEVEIRVGVWLMPDNRREGGIEAFLADLAASAEHRPVLIHAQASTKMLIDAGLRTFSPSVRRKAELRAFLAWQEEPGCSYGVAVQRKYFDAEAAGAFAAWFRRLYGPPE